MAIKPSLKRMLFLLLSIFLLAGALVCFSAFIRPAYDDVAAGRSKLSNRKNIVEENKVVVQKTQGLLTQFNNSAELDSVVSSILPKEPNSSQIVNQVTNLAKINGLTISTINVSLDAIRPPEKTGELVKGVGIISVDFKMDGNYENFKAFLKNLETNINLIEPVTVRVNSLSGKINYSISIETYYQGK